MILLSEWISFDRSYTEFFDIFIQLGAILAVIIFFWKRFWPFDIKLWSRILVAVIPALIIGGLFGNHIRQYLFNFQTVSIALIFGGLIMVFVENLNIKPKYNSISELSWGSVFIIGLIQCLAMIPGTSRSATTIISALILGYSRTLAVEFSFFLAIPTIIAASGYSLVKYGLSIRIDELIIVIIGFLASFIVALFVIKFLLKYIKTHDFKFFAYYRIILGIVFLIYFLNQ